VNTALICKGVVWFWGVYMYLADIFSCRGKLVTRLMDKYNVY